MQMKVLRRNSRCHGDVKSGFKILSFFFFTCMFTSCAVTKNTAYNPTEKIAPEKLQEDFSVLKKVLEADHPSLYWYMPKDSIDRYYSETEKSLKDSLTELQFRSRVAWFVSKIKCGHTSVQPSKFYADYATAHKISRFPLLLKVWNDSIVTLGSLTKGDTIFKRGTIITSIEHFSNRQLLDSMFQFISTDGYSDNFKDQAVSFNFPLYYSLAFPLKDSFYVRYIDKSGRERETFVPLNKPIADTSKKDLHIPPGVIEKTPSHKQIKKIILTDKRSIMLDSVNKTAYMRLATFSGGKLRAFFKQSFSEIRKEGIHDLVIDLRENSGGNINMSTLLTRYLKDTSFKIADTVAAVNRRIEYSRYIKPSLPYKIAMRLTTVKKVDGKFHFKQLENKNFMPFKRKHFEGHLYLIQGGYTFSAAAMFVHNLQQQNNVTVVGEETGGGKYGMSAVHLPEIILPNTKLRIVLPLYRVVLDKNAVQDGRGIWPDVAVPPSSIAIRNGIDPKLEEVKILIQGERTHK